MAASSHGKQNPEVFTRVLLVWSQVMTVWYLRLQWRSILARMETLQSMSPYTRPIIRIIITTTRIWLYVKCVLCLSTMQYEGHVHIPEQCSSLGNNVRIKSKAMQQFLLVLLVCHFFFNSRGGVGDILTLGHLHKLTVHGGKDCDQSGIC